MRFGVSLLGLVQQPRDEDLGARMRDVLVWVEEAQEAGFRYVMTGQHYLSAPFQALQPVPLLARLIPETGDMGLVSTVVATLQNPVDLAETWASLDQISGGRVGLSLALGYRDDEYAAFGVERRHRVRVFKEVVETLVRLWTEEEVSVAGERFTLDRAVCTIRPIQQPHVPIWIAASADAAVERAARWGLRWNIGPLDTFDTIQRQVSLHRRTVDGCGFAPMGFPLHREAFCLPTREEALELAKPFLEQKYAAYSRWAGDAGLAADFETLARDRFILGDPEDCAREIERYRTLGVDSLHVRMNWPGMPLAAGLESLRLFGSEVIPRFSTSGS
jgi:alkanesulfonate monooxygenase SsuD/methylene tetrahydromethanopterin reductase-like flavin-dependent oxidoreductase (luciferase family)